MRKGVCFWVVCLWCILKVDAQVPESDQVCLKQIRENYIQVLISSDKEKSDYLDLLSEIPVEKEISDQNIVELYQRFLTRPEEVRQWMATLQADGSWADINYKDRKRSGWEPKKHVERILGLAKFFYASAGNHPEIDRDSLLTVIHQALNFWFKRDFSCLNWWYNQIGVPRTLGGAFLLLWEELSPEEREAAIREMKYSKFGMTGQNKVWLAGNVLMRGLLEEDYTLVKDARENIFSEIVLGKPEGIKSDWSFHQHGPQQQMGNYGLSFLSNMCLYVEIFAHTPLAMSEQQREVLFSFFKEGYQWFVWRGRMDVNALNRQLFHNADIHKAYTLLFAVHSLMKGSNAKQAKEIREFIRCNFLKPGMKNRWIGNKVFWDSDETVHRTSRWMASVKMASDRVIGTELVNEDNKLGYYLGDGAMYVYTDGNPYHNVFPCWDWRKIPGITCVESVDPIPTHYGTQARNHSRFVGGVTNGKTGITAMELNRDGVYAHKAWIFTDHFVLCLGSGIRGEQQALTTSMEQALKSGDLLVKNNQNWEKVSQEYRSAGQDVRFYHGNTGYIVLQADTCVGKVENRSGQWYDVMGMYKQQQVQTEVTTLYLKHQGGEDANYQYIVLPAVSEKQVAKFDETKIQVISNTRERQAVVIGGMCYVVAYQPGEIILPDGKKFEIETPGLYLCDWKHKNGNIRALDPTRSYQQMKMNWKGKKMVLPTDKNGFAFHE